MRELSGAREIYDAALRLNPRSVELAQKFDTARKHFALTRKNTRWRKAPKELRAPQAKSKLRSSEFVLRARWKKASQFTSSAIKFISGR
jgi:hypothetical protein